MPIESGIEGKTWERKDICMKTKGILTSILALLAACTLLTPTRADVLVTKRGSRWEGAVAEDGDSYLLTKPDGSKVRFPKSIVSQVHKTGEAGNATRAKSRSGIAESAGRAHAHSRPPAPPASAAVMPADKEEVVLLTALAPGNARVFKQNTKGTMTMDLSGREQGMNVRFLMTLHVDSTLRLRFEGGQERDGIVHTRWCPLDNTLDLQGSIKLTIGAQSESVPLKGKMHVSAESSSGWMEAEGQGRETFSQTDLSEMRRSLGIGTTLVVDMTKHGRVVAWRAMDDLAGGFDDEQQANVVAMISGLIAPIFPETSVVPQDEWKATPGTKKEPILKAEIAVAPEALVGRFASLQKIVQGQLAREKAAGSPLGGDGSMLSPFAWGVDLDYVYRGFSVDSVRGKTRWLSYSAQIKDQHVDVPDLPRGIDVHFLDVAGNLHLDPATGWPRESTAKLKMKFGAKDTTTNMRIDAELDATTRVQ